ncbi:protein-disulfide reductase DsbD family protein [Pseudonocardia sp. TMWB2A]|uniref:protein-disulfide reductase DsbD family protein n=1 Tax=Pseudonocardia sp. TMWB2A TaxID=687430 RepID=UPI00307CE1C7
MQLRNHSVPFHYDALLTILRMWAGALLLVLAGPATAQLGGGYERHLAGELVAETYSPAPGDTVMLAFHMRPDAGWHGYWENPGDAGLGMTVEWSLPDGVTAGTLQYPVPGTLILSGLMNHVYERDYAVLVPVTIPANAAKGTVLPVRVKASALVCDDKLCLPQDFSLATELTVGDGAIAPEARAQFDGWRAKLPRPLTLGARDALYELTADRLKIGVKLPQSLTLDSPHLFAATTDVIDYAAPQRFYRSGDWLVMEGKPNVTPGVTIKGLDSLLKIAPDTGLRFTATPAKAGELPASGTTVGGASAGGAFDAKLLLIALGGAIVGGLLLNIMPCVFPILSLKAISIARAGGDQTTVRREAWAYAAGVVAVCLALGLVILGLRAGGEQVGWAFQLQNPVMVFLLLLLVAGITANLAGLFELGGLSITSSGPQRGGTGGAFLTGALAAIVATPCTGPFMGAALGATMVLPGWAALVIFGGLGVGIALPFLLIAYSETLRARLPKPGPWMETFRHWMAVPMTLTLLALGWLLWRMAGDAGLMAAILGALIVGLFAFVYGRSQRQGKRLGPILLPLLVLSAAMGAMLVRGHAPVEAGKTRLAGAPYSETALASARASGKPVFVYFTADWCVTCKINEGAAINRSETEAAFKAAGVTVLVGDWTDGNADITRALAARGRNSVPLYLWYRPGADQPEVLPQILTVSMLTDRAKGK